MAEHNYEHLYDVSIETLDLSDEANRVLQKRAVLSVGDCIDFYNRDKGALIVMVPPFGRVMNSEVMEKIKAHGYWQYVDESR